MPHTFQLNIPNNPSVTVQINLSNVQQPPRARRDRAENLSDTPRRHRRRRYNQLALPFLPRPPRLPQIPNGDPIMPAAYIQPAPTNNGVRPPQTGTIRMQQIYTQLSIDTPPDPAPLMPAELGPRIMPAFNQQNQEQLAVGAMNRPAPEPPLPWGDPFAHIEPFVTLNAESLNRMNSNARLFMATNTFEAPLANYNYVNPTEDGYCCLAAPRRYADRPLVNIPYADYNARQVSSSAPTTEYFHNRQNNLPEFNTPYYGGTGLPNCSEMRHGNYNVRNMEMPSCSTSRNDRGEGAIGNMVTSDIGSTDTVVSGMKNIAIDDDDDVILVDDVPQQTGGDQGPATSDGKLKTQPTGNNSGNPAVTPGRSTHVAARCDPRQSAKMEHMPYPMPIPKIENVSSPTRAINDVPQNVVIQENRPREIKEEKFTLMNAD